MTAMSIVRKLWKNASRQKSYAAVADIETLLESFQMDETDSIWDRWRERNQEVNTYVYSRVRDHRRAYRATDLRLAATLDQIDRQKK